MVDTIRSLIREIPDHPKPGILFYDITPVLANPDGFAALIEAMTAPFRASGITKVAGIEARGFTLAAPWPRNSAPDSCRSANPGSCRTG